MIGVSGVLAVAVIVPPMTDAIERPALSLQGGGL
jgi:hypothetical protein